MVKQWVFSKSGAKLQHFFGICKSWYYVLEHNIEKRPQPRAAQRQKNKDKRPLRSKTKDRGGVAQRPIHMRAKNKEQRQKTASLKDKRPRRSRSKTKVERQK
jgi:hypothetical protein